jgi:hypothetical protein
METACSSEMLICAYNLSGVVTHNNKIIFNAVTTPNLTITMLNVINITHDIILSTYLLEEHLGAHVRKKCFLKMFFLSLML